MVSIHPRFNLHFLLSLAHLSSSVFHLHLLFSLHVRTTMTTLNNNLSCTSPTIVQGSNSFVLYSVQFRDSTHPNILISTTPSSGSVLLKCVNVVVTSSQINYCYYYYLFSLSLPYLYFAKLMYIRFKESQLTDIIFIY